MECILNESQIFDLFIMSTPSLSGITVVGFESRMADATANLIEKYDGEALSAPSLQEAPLESHDAVFDFADELFAGRIDIALFMTGVGTRMLFDTLELEYDSGEAVDALSETVVVARGPKPTRELKDYDVPIAEKVPEPNTWREALEVLTTSTKTTPLEGKRVAVQEYGRPNRELNGVLRKKGADLVRVPIYRWELPDNLEPLKEGIHALITGEARVALFTSRQQIEHVLQVAAEKGLEDDFRAALDDRIVASVGPICSEALEEEGIGVDFEPERPKLGILIRGLAENAHALLQSV